LHDAALQWKHKAGASEFAIDLPFGADTANPTGNAFVFGAAKAQAYFKHNLSDAFSVQVGQFDTIYGFELNDSRDVFFTKQGLVWNNILPVTHLGILTNYTSGKVTAKVMLANPTNAGMLANKNPEAGFQLAYAVSDTSALTLGILYANQSDVSTVLYDFLAGSNVTKELRLDVEADIKTVTDQDVGMGFLVNGIYTVDSKWSLGARIEYLRKINDYSDIGLTVGPAVQVDDHLKFRADYSWVASTVTKGADAVNSNVVAFSGIYSF
jgi:hypothetical protein